MAQTIKFIGDPSRDGDGPDEITVWNHTFKKGRATPCSDEAALAKAMGNSHFQVKGKADDANGK